MFDVPSTPCLNTRGKSCHRLQAYSGCGAASKTTAAKPPRRLMRTRLVALALGLACSLPLAFGPGLAQAEARDTQIHAIRGFMPDLKFSLQGANARTYSQDDFRGKVVMMFFGYANCPDICPTTMAQLAEVMEKLGDQAEKVRIIFVSVDPHRDEPEMLQAYVEAFDDRYATGLSGTEKQIADLARRYRVAYQIEKPPADNPNRYEVAHSRGIYIFDEQGKARYLASDSESVDDLLATVQKLL